jgi:hypothetical protein
MFSDNDVRELAIARTRIMMRDAIRAGIPGAVSLAALLSDADYYAAACADACAHVSCDAAALGNAKLARNATMLHMAWLMLQRGRRTAAHGYLHSV